MTIVSFAIQKGGTAKTTTTVMLAAWLALKRKKVLLIDLDPQANATECLVDPLAIRDDDCLRELLLGESGIDSVVHQSHDIGNLSFIPSKPRMLIDEYFGRFSGLMPHILRGKLKRIKEKYDYILCDCPPNLLHFTKNALWASDYIVVPLEPEPLAVDGLERLVSDILPDIYKENSTLKIGGAVLIHRAQRTRIYIPEEARRRIDRLLGPRMRFTVEVPLDQKLAEMRDYHQPACIYARNCQGSEYYRALADEFIVRVPP
jgi:chromosome partitioning protein